MARFYDATAPVRAKVAAARAADETPSPFDRSPQESQSDSGWGSEAGEEEDGLAGPSRVQGQGQASGSGSGSESESELGRPEPETGSQRSDSFTSDEAEAVSPEWTTLDHVDPDFLEDLHVRQCHRSGDAQYGTSQVAQRKGQIKGQRSEMRGSQGRTTAYRGTLAEPKTRNSGRRRVGAMDIFLTTVVIVSALFITWTNPWLAATIVGIRFFL